MKLTGTVYTTNKRLAQKHEDEIRAIVEIAKNVKLGRIEYVSTAIQNMKTKKDGKAVRPDWDWFAEQCTTDGNLAILHISRKEANTYKLTSGIGKPLGGSYNKDIGDSTLDFLIVADNKKDYVRRFVHELSHGLAHWFGVPDLTHTYDYDKGDLKALYKTYDATKWDELHTKVSLLTKLKNLLFAFKKVTPTTLHKRLPNPYNDYISQGYGVANPIYKITGRHVGIDYACPRGTKVYAPWDGEITVTGNHSTLGNFCYFTYTWEGYTRVERLMHLDEIPQQGTYKRGDVIAYTGTTGMSTGPHLHVDGWYKEVNTGILNKTNWDTLTYDPHIA